MAGFLGKILNAFRTFRVVEHSEDWQDDLRWGCDLWSEGKWVLNDITSERTLAAGVMAGWRGVHCGSYEYWIPPNAHVRLSAGVPLRWMKPRCVVPTHRGKLLLLERKKRLQLVTANSFFDGLRAVRRKFEQDLRAGRHAATTAEERVANLRKCRDKMNANSDQVVEEHMKVLPVEWKGVDETSSSIDWYAVLRLTSADGRPVEERNETNVAVLGRFRCVMIHVGEKGDIEVECLSRPEKLKFCSLSRSGTVGHCYTEVYGQSISLGTVNRIRYVRDSSTNEQRLQTTGVVGAKWCNLLPVRDESGSGGRWLVLRSGDFGAVFIYDTESDKVACLAIPSRPSGGIETAEGLWLLDCGTLRTELSRWAKFFTVDALQSLDYIDVSETRQLVPQPSVPSCVIADEALESAAFWKGESGQRRRRIDRHPGHYWVVAGYGPVPIRLRAPAHIYKQLEFGHQQPYCDSPRWAAFDDAPWLVHDVNADDDNPIWVGYIDLRPGVTAHSIRDDPEADDWSAGGRAVSSGHFLVKGKAMSTLPCSVSLEVPVKPGRWLWSAETVGSRAELTLRHESVTDGEMRSCATWIEVLPKSFYHWESCLAGLSEVAPLIKEEALRAKIAEFSEWVYPEENEVEEGTSDEMFTERCPFLLLDKDTLSNSAAAWPGQNLMRDDAVGKLVVPLKSGIALVYLGSAPSFCVRGGTLIRIRFHRS